MESTPHCHHAHRTTPHRAATTTANRRLICPLCPQLVPWPLHPPQRGPSVCPSRLDKGNVWLLQGSFPRRVSVNNALSKRPPSLAKKGARGHSRVAMFVVDCEHVHRPLGPPDPLFHLSPFAGSGPCCCFGVLPAPVTAAIDWSTTYDWRRPRTPGPLDC